MKTTIVVPTFNEAENLPKLATGLFALPIADLTLLVVDDNSPDGTGRIAEEIKQSHQGRMEVIHRTGKLGLGTAYITGFRHALEAGADFIGQMDADFSHPLEKLVAMREAAEAHDLVVGSRYVPGGSLDERWPFWRKALSGWGNFYARTILSVPIRDITGGYRLWRRTTLLGLPLERVRSNGYVFQVEMGYLAHLLGFTVHEIPIYFADRRWGKSKMSFRIQAEAAVRVWRLRGMYRDLSG